MSVHRKQTRMNDKNFIHCRMNLGGRVESAAFRDLRIHAKHRFKAKQDSLLYKPSQHEITL